MTSNPLQSQAPVMVTTSQVAMMVGVCLRSVRYWEAKGIMPARTTGYRRLYVWEDVKIVLQFYITEKAYVVTTKDKLLQFIQRSEAIEHNMFDYVPTPPQDVQPPTA